MPEKPSTNGHDTTPNRHRWTPRKTAFVRHYLDGMSGVDAARAAGFLSERSTSHRLLHHDPQVIEAIRRGRAARDTIQAVTKDAMIRQADADRALAIEANDAMAAVRASELKARLAGLIPGSLETVPNRPEER